MATTISTTTVKKPAFICASCARSMRKAFKPSIDNKRALSSSTWRPAANTGVAHIEDRSQVPRWKQTPPAMKMPFRVRPLPKQPVWKVNENQDALDRALDSFIGDAAGRGVKGGDLLTEEVKWLAVTHKSFEQGARGYNDRLAFLGKRIVELQASKALLEAPPISPLPSLKSTLDGRASRIGPLQTHPALKGVENITTFAKQTTLAPNRLNALAVKYGLVKVVRWKPRQVELLGFSGVESVMAHALYAIIGAIALEKGGRIANEVAKQRILRPLGLHFTQDV